MFILAQTNTFGATVTGQVLDVDNQPVAKVLVTAIHLPTEFGGVAITDDRGEFRIADLPPGEFRVAGSKKGLRIRPVTLPLDIEKAGRVTLSALPAMGGVQGHAIEDQPKNYSKVTVFYGTDRKPASTNPLTFGSERGGLSLGTCEVSIPRDHLIGSLESPALWRLEFRPDPDKHIALLGTTRVDSARFRALLGQSLSKKGVALVFIHGFNVGFEEAARRTAQITYDIAGFEGVPNFYSWPSNGNFLSYTADGDQAQRAVRFFAEYLQTVTSSAGVNEVHLIAHSMGNRVLTAALQELRQDAAAGHGPKIGQVVLVAPDIDAEIFREDIAPRISGIGARITLYASDRDKALLLSKQTHNFPRAGDIRDGVMIVPGVDTIDVSAVDTSLVGHSYFADNRSIISDLYQLLGNGTAPGARFGMRAMKSQGLTYWRFAP
jgi:esterase/lipase superfamily enzyme